MARVSALGCKRFRPATTVLLAGVPGCADGMQARRNAAFSPLPRAKRQRTLPRAACCCAWPRGGRHAHRRSPGQRTGSHWSLHCGQRVRHPQDGATPARAGEAGACLCRLHRPSPTGPPTQAISHPVRRCVCIPGKQKAENWKARFIQRLPKALTNTLQDTHDHLPPPKATLRISDYHPHAPKAPGRITGDHSTKRQTLASVRLAQKCN